MIIGKKAFEIQALNKDFNVVKDVNLAIDYLCSQIITNYTALHCDLKKDAEIATKETGVEYLAEDMAVNPYNLLDMDCFSKNIKLNNKNISYEETRDLAECLDTYIASTKDYFETIEFKELVKDKASSILCELDFDLNYIICRIGNKEYSFIEILEK